MLRKNLKPELNSLLNVINYHEFVSCFRCELSFADSSSKKKKKVSHMIFTRNFFQGKHFGVLKNSLVFFSFLFPLRENIFFRFDFQNFLYRLFLAPPPFFNIYFFPFICSRLDSRSKKWVTCLLFHNPSPLSAPLPHPLKYSEILEKDQRAFFFIFYTLTSDINFFFFFKYIIGINL